MAYRFSNFLSAIPGAAPAPISLFPAEGLAHARGMKQLAIQQQQADTAAAMQEESRRNNERVAAKNAATLEANARKAQQEAEVAALEQDAAGRPEYANAIRAAYGIPGAAPVAPAPQPAPQATAPVTGASRSEQAPQTMPGPVDPVAVANAALAKHGVAPLGQPDAPPPGATPAQPADPMTAPVRVPPGIKFPEEFSRNTMSLRAITKGLVDSAPKGWMRQAATQLMGKEEEVLIASGNDVAKAADYIKGTYEKNISALKPSSPLVQVGGGGKPGDRLEVTAAQQVLEKSLASTGAKEATAMWESSTAALKLLRESGNNVSALSSVAYELAHAMNGTGVLTDRDVNNVFGMTDVKSFLAQGVDVIQNQILGLGGDSEKVQRLQELLVKMQSRAAEKIERSYKNVQREMKAWGSLNMAPEFRGAYDVLAQSHYGGYFEHKAKADEMKKRASQISSGSAEKPAPNPFDEGLE